MYSICNELHARWGHLTYTHCVPGVMNSMCAGFSCAGFHVRRAPCLPGSCAQGYTLARFHGYRVPRLPGSMLTGFHACQVPCLPGSSYVGFHAYRAPFVTGSCTQVSHVSGSICSQFLCDELQPRRVPSMPVSNHAGSMLTGFYVL